MMIVFLISAAVTVFLLVIAVLVMLTGRDPVEARLMEVSAYTAPDAGTLIAATPSTGLARVDAYMLTSVACDLRVTQMVDGNKGVHAMLAKSLLVPQ